MRIFSELAANQLRAAEHIAPLVVPAELQIAAVFFIQRQKVIALHDHVVEFQERKPLFHALLIAFRAQHVVHGEAGAHLPQKLNIIQIQQPVRIVDQHCLALGKIDKAAHLLSEAIDIVRNGLLRHHCAHIRAAGGVAHHCRTAADEGNGTVACHLQPLHQAKRHEMPHMQAVGGWVKADVKYRLARIDQGRDLLLVCHLRDQTARFQLLIYCHLFSPHFLVFSRGR